MPIKIVPKEDKKLAAMKKMRSAAVREEMMDMMRAGEAPKDMKDRLDKVGRESDSEYRRRNQRQGHEKRRFSKVFSLQAC
jgi:ribose 1,5-bisphosphokinase PhnN